MNALSDKLKKLDDIIASYGSLAIAFSGGMDSTFLLLHSRRIPGITVTAVTARSSIFPSEEAAESMELCRKFGIKQITVDLGSDFFDKIKYNGADVCYTCKKAMFTAMKDTVFPLPLADGTNGDDPGDYRPGLKALDELGILSPLKEAGLGKRDIKELLKKTAPDLDIPLPSACLVSRISYGEPLDEKKLAAIDYLEIALRDMGFSSVRVRSHGDLARVEVAASERERFADVDIMDKVSKLVKRSGFIYASLDLDGYRTGSLNDSLASEKRICKRK